MKKHITPLRLAWIILLLAALTLIPLIAVSARYTASSESAPEGARVAAFSVSIGDTVTTPLAELLPGDTVEVEIVVDMDTEVKTGCRLVATTEGNLPLTVSVTEDADFEPGQSTYTGKVTVTWPDDQKSADFAGLSDLLTVSVVAEQLD